MGVLRRRKREEGETGFGAGGIGGSERPKITPVDVQQKVFRLGFRGYNERDVDEFLDVVTEDLARLHEENKRLREELDLRGGGESGLEEARRHAEETVRQAREQASKIIEEAERRAGLASAAGGPVPPSFLVRERSFLQEMASLIQTHADFLKEQARRAKGNAQAEPRHAPEPDDEREEGSPGNLSGDQHPPLEATAPMEVVRADEERGPTVSDWSRPFATEEGDAEASAAPDQHSPVQGGFAAESDEEPSLRELFWGEE